MAEEDQTNKILQEKYKGLSKQQSQEQKKIVKPSKANKLPKIKTEQNQQLSPQKTHDSPTKFKRQRIIPQGYQLADYNKAMEHWYKSSYSKKRVDNDGDDYYQQYSVFDDISDLKHEKGIYLYMEFIKRLLITFFIISVLMILPLYLNYFSNGLQGYKDSFALTLAKFSIGNLNYADQKTYIMESACDVLGMLVLFGFYFHWRSFHYDIVNEEEKDFSTLDPGMYVITIVGFDKKTPNLESQLKAYFDTIYRGAYEVEIVHDFKRNFGKFIDYEQKLEEVQKEKEVLRQTNKSNDHLLQIEKELELMEDELAKISSDFEPIYALIHFRNLKAKYAFMNVCKKYGLVNKFSASFRRCICCIPGLPEKLKFNRKDDLMIESVNIPKPQSINWDNADISKGSYACRFIFSILFIAISIFITSSLIALCTLYVATSSNCGSFDPDTTFQQAKDSNDKLTIYCYCSANYASIYTDSGVSSLCSQLEQTILISNIVQIGASLVSTVTNIILIVIVSIIAEKLLKPDTKPKEYNFIFITVFLSNLINSTILPLILNGDIFGFKSVSFLTFIDFINFQKVTIFKDFDRNWFAIVSPYYTNFFIIASISPLIQIVVYTLKRKYVLWRLKKKCENNDPSDPTIQKQADVLVCSFPIDLPVEMSVMCLQFFMCYMYASLIPLAVPIFTFNLLLSFFCKRYIILNYTKRVPANESLNEKIINLLPFIILVHGLMGIWARTADGIFDQSAYFKLIDFTMISNIVVQRAIADIIMLGAIAVIVCWIIFDYTIVTFFNFLRESCKDELELPVVFSSIENSDYANRLRTTNIVGSYKLTNHPVYKHPFKAFMELMKRVQLEKRQQNKNLGLTSEMNSQMHLNSSVIHH